MEWKIIHIDETDSTNRWLRERANSQQLNANSQRLRVGEQSSGMTPIAVWADFQTAGKGQGSNTWESERGKNLLFSILFHPNCVPANRQFSISMAISMAVINALSQQIGNLSVKWPNDIYWQNAKIGGILIENRLQGQMIKDSIIGVGINVNQREFHSDAPNPVSLWQIHGHETDREQLLHDILDRFSRYMERDVRDDYMRMLYRRKGLHPYSDANGTFMAEFVDVEEDGHLLLRDDNGRDRRYAFKEVQFIT